MFGNECVFVEETEGWKVGGGKETQLDTVSSERKKGPEGFVSCFFVYSRLQHRVARLHLRIFYLTHYFEVVGLCSVPPPCLFARKIDHV